MELTRTSEYYPIRSALFLYIMDRISLYFCVSYLVCIPYLRFYKYLAMNMQNPAKVVYTSSAEVVGITLKYLTDTERGSENTDWLTQYQENISNMLLSFQETKPDRFICCVHRMQLHYPAIADRYV